MQFKLTLVLFVGLTAFSAALPAKNRLVYQPSARYSSPPQHLMYVQYVQPAANPYARSAQAASALVAGDAVATQTVLEDCNPIEGDVAADEVAQGEEVLSETGVIQGAHSIAEAYPAAEPTVEDDDAYAQVPVAESNPSKTPRDLDLATQTGVADLPAPAPLAPLQPVAPAAPAAPAAPVAPPSRAYIPAKKVFVELDPTPEYEPAEETPTVPEDEPEEVEEAEEEAVDTAVAPVQPALPARRVPAPRQPASRRKTAIATAVRAGNQGASKPAAGGTYFPIDFGGTSGGAIAIANSYSTGEGGSATSHAIAYGSPEGARTRIRQKS